MRRLLATFLALGLSATASAQDREPGAGERAAVMTAGMVGGVGAVAGAYALIPSWYDTPEGAALLVLAYPAGMALGTVAAAELLGLDARPFETAQDALLGAAAGAFAGALVGVGVGGTTYFAMGQQDVDLVSLFVGGGLGALTALGVSAAIASHRVGAGPAAFRVPTGEAGTGLTLRIGL